MRKRRRHKIPESHHLPCRRGAEKPAGWIDGLMDAKMNGWKIERDAMRKGRKTFKILPFFFPSALSLSLRIEPMV